MKEQRSSQPLCRDGRKGQCCCAIERLYVADSVYDAFVERFVDVVSREWRVGDPKVEETSVGAMALPDAPDILGSQVVDAVERGGKLLLGGEKTQVGGKGRFFEPTVIAEATEEMLLM